MLCILSTKLCNHSLIVSYASIKSTAEYLLQQIDVNTVYLSQLLHPLHWGGLSSAVRQRLHPGAGFPNTVGGSIPPGHLGIFISV